MTPRHRREARERLEKALPANQWWDDGPTLGEIRRGERKPGERRAVYPLPCEPGRLGELQTFAAHAVTDLRAALDAIAVRDAEAEQLRGEVILMRGLLERTLPFLWKWCGDCDGRGRRDVPGYGGIGDPDPGNPPTERCATCDGLGRVWAKLRDEVIRKVTDPETAGGEGGG